MKITIKRISRKKGEYTNKKGDVKPWERVSIFDGKNWYGTFKADWRGNAHVLDKWAEGMNVDVDVQQDEKGFWVILPPEEASAPIPAGLDLQREIMDELTALKENEEEIRKLILGLSSEIIKLSERLQNAPGDDEPPLPDLEPIEETEF